MRLVEVYCLVTIKGDICGGDEDEVNVYLKA